MSEKRKAGDYEITHSIYIGDTELVMGENLQASDGNFYMVADCEKNELFSSYENCLVSDDFLEIAKIFSDRLTAQVENLQKERAHLPSPQMITPDMCCPLSYEDNIDGKIIAMKPSSLRCEHQTATKQLFRVTGGFGANGNSRGQAVFVENLYSGKHTRIDRSDVAGVIKPSCLPHWAKEKLAIRQNKQHTKKKSEKEVER